MAIRLLLIRLITVGGLAAVVLAQPAVTTQPVRETLPMWYERAASILASVQTAEDFNEKLRELEDGREAHRIHPDRVFIGNDETEAMAAGQRYFEALRTSVIKIEEQAKRLRVISPRVGSQALFRLGLSAKNVEELKRPDFSTPEGKKELKDRFEASRKDLAELNFQALVEAALRASSSNEGKLPPDLAGLARQFPWLTVDVFKHPGSRSQLPKGAADLSPEQVMEWVHKNNDYLLIGAGKQLDRVRRDNEILLCENPAIGFATVRMVLGSGQVRSMPREQAIMAIATSGSLAELEKIALTGEPAQRTMAIELLCIREAATPNTYLKLLQDKDPGIRRLSIKPAARLMSGLQGSEWPAHMPLLKELIDLVMRDPTARESGGLALRSLAHRTFGLEEMDKLFAQLDTSAELDDRAMATAIRWGMYWSKPDRGGVTRERMLEGIRSKFAWVRAVATDAVFREGTPIEPVDGRAALRAAIGDANVDVSREAALRLVGALPVYIGNLTYAGAEATISRPMGPSANVSVPSIDAKDPAQRIRALKSLDGGAPIPSVIAATTRFDDPDPSVAKEARAASLRLIDAFEATKRK